MGGSLRRGGPFICTAWFFLSEFEKNMSGGAYAMTVTKHSTPAKRKTYRKFKKKIKLKNGGYFVVSIPAFYHPRLATC